MESPLSRSVSNSLSQSGRKRVIKRVVVRKVKQTPTQIQNLNPPQQNSSIIQNSPIQSPIRPLELSSRDISPLRSPLNSRALSGTKSAIQTNFSPIKVPGSSPTLTRKSRTPSKPAQNPRNTPNRFNTSLFDIPEKRPRKALSPTSYNHLQQERKINLNLQSQLDFLTDRDLFSSLQNEISALKSEISSKNSEIKTLNGVVKEREKAIKQLEKTDIGGNSLFDKLKAEILYKNKENLAQKNTIKQLQETLKKYEKREIMFNDKFPEIFYRISGENCEIDEIVHKLEEIIQQSISNRMQCENLEWKRTESEKEIAELLKEKESYNKVVQSIQERGEKEIKSLKLRNAELDDKLMHFSADYEELIKEYRKVIQGVQGKDDGEDSFDYGGYIGEEQEM